MVTTEEKSELTKTHYTEWHENHDRMVEMQIQTLKKEGFRTIRVDSKRIPDIIALKDGKAYAVEITAHKTPWFGKWANQTDYDDIVWIVNGQIKKPIGKGNSSRRPEVRAKLSLALKGRKMIWAKKAQESRLKHQYGERWTEYVRYPKTCLNCGKMFKVNGGTHTRYLRCNWCSKECWYAYRQRNLVPRMTRSQDGKFVR